MAYPQRWSDLSPGVQKMLIAFATAEMALTTIALTDLARRPASQVRGPKPLWAVGCFVQPIGPLAYLRWGRRA